MISKTDQVCQIVRTYKYKISSNFEYKERFNIRDIKTIEVNFTSEYLSSGNIVKEFQDNVDDNSQWINIHRKAYEGFVCDYKFLGLRNIRMIMNHKDHLVE